MLEFERSSTPSLCAFRIARCTSSSPTKNVCGCAASLPAARHNNDIGANITRSGWQGMGLFPLHLPQIWMHLRHGFLLRGMGLKIRPIQSRRCLRPQLDEDSCSRIVDILRQWNSDSDYDRLFYGRTVSAGFQIRASLRGAMDRAVFTKWGLFTEARSGSLAYRL